MRTASRIAFAAFFSGALLLGGATVATADPLLDAQLTESEVRDFLDAYGVEPETQDNLLAKQAAGIVLDEESGAAPVSTETEVIGTQRVTVERWADGSLRVATTDLPVDQEEGATSRVIANCAYDAANSNSYQKAYVNCLNSIQTTGTYIAFNFGYTHFSGGAKISYTNNKVIRMSNKVIFDQVLQITRQTTSGALAATARYTVYSTAGSNTYTTWLQLNLSASGTATTSYSG